MRYVAVDRIWHRGEEREIAPDELVDLSHLTEEEIARLVEMGAVKEIGDDVTWPVASEPEPTVED